MKVPWLRKKGDRPGRRFVVGAFLTAIGLVFQVPSILAAEGGQASPDKWGTPLAVGFLYPGISVRCAWWRVALEGFVLREGKTSVLGPRLYYLFNPGSRVVFNLGGECAWVKGGTEVQEYSGRALTGFLGMEFFSTQKISVGFDMGLCQVSLDGERERNVSEIGLVANAAVRFYLGRGR